MVSSRWPRRRRRARGSSIRCSRSRCRTPRSRMPAIRSSCAWSTSTATATAMWSKPWTCASRRAPPAIPKCCDLSETGPNTGVFVGYVPTAHQRRVGRLRAAGRAQCRARCHLRGPHATTATRRRPTRWSIRTAWCSIRRPVCRSTARACASSTPPPALPATVFGDDGVSRYPNEMVTGQTVTDQGGTQYSMPAGVFRFPLVVPGTYRLEVLPPGSYCIPFAAHDRRSADAAECAVPPAAGILRPEFHRHGRAGRGRRPAARRQRRACWCCARPPASRSPPPATSCSTRSRCRTTARSGAFNNVQIVDRFPAGARFRAGLAAPRRHAHRRSRRSPPTAPASPTRSPAWPRARRITLRYVLEYTVAMRGSKDAINTAQAFAPGNVRSNEARSLVRMNEELFSQKGFIVGRVFEGQLRGRRPRSSMASPTCASISRTAATASPMTTATSTSKASNPGTHTVQLDKLTLPEYLELAPCADRLGHAGRDYSQFAELHAGTLWRSDFVVRQKKAPEGRRGIRIHTRRCRQIRTATAWRCTKPWCA